MTTLDVIFHDEYVEELDRCMLLRVARRARDEIIGAYFFGVLCGVALAVVVAVLQ